MAQMIERQLTHRGAARSVSGLAAVLAHEIKNPLSGIRGAAQLLESERTDSDRTLTQLICAESDRICKLVDRMEIFGDERPLAARAGQHSRRARPCEADRDARGFARQIKIVENYDPSLPSVPGSRDKLIQVFLNLVKNAAEAIGEERADGQITLTTSFRPGVRLSVPGSQARVSLPLEIAVEDNGAGVPTDLMPHLFDPFVTTKPSGTGLGLALVAKIIGDHGGIIECDSRPRLTVFRALMPMAESETTHTGGPKTMGKGNILIADDDAAIRTVLNQALARAGYAPRATGNAATLWRWISQGEGDLVITDVLMPDESAFDLIPRVKKLRPDLPIIVMSAQNTFMTAITAAERGAYEYLPKPFDLNELVAVVGRALAEPRKRIPAACRPRPMKACR